MKNIFLNVAIVDLVQNCMLHMPTKNQHCSLKTSENVFFLLTAGKHLLQVFSVVIFDAISHFLIASTPIKITAGA